MMSYQQLDFVADSYIPILLLFVLITLLKGVFKEGVLKVLQSALPFIIGVVFIYALMFIDNTFKIWTTLTLDYSTHTALALVFVCGVSFWGKKQRITVITSMIFYCLLMLYQQYHTVMDILSTVVVVLPMLCLINLRLKRTTTS